MLRSFRKGSGRICIIIVLSLSGHLTACSKADRELTPQEVSNLEQRVQDRWSAMADHNFGLVYEFTTPTYRSIFSKDMFVNKFSYAVDWELTGVEVVNYDAGAAVASVVARVMTRSTKLTEYASSGYGVVPTELREQWLYVDGEWWYSANK